MSSVNILFVDKLKKDKAHEIYLSSSFLLGHMASLRAPKMTAWEVSSCYMLGSILSALQKFM